MKRILVAGHNRDREAVDQLAWHRWGYLGLFIKRFYTPIYVPLLAAG
jgi:hypothetical protein